MKIKSERVLKKGILKEDSEDAYGDMYTKLYKKLGKEYGLSESEIDNALADISDIYFSTMVERGYGVDFAEDMIVQYLDNFLVDENHDTIDEDELNEIMGIIHKGFDADNYVAKVDAYMNDDDDSTDTTSGADGKASTHGNLKEAVDAKSVKDLSKWLKDEVEFLKENPDYVGGWNQLGNGLAAVVLWAEGYGDEKRNDVIQSEDDPDWGLNAEIRIYNPSDTPDGWIGLYDENGDIVTESSSISPNEDYDKLAQWLLGIYDKVKDVDYDKEGNITSKAKEEGKEDMKEGYSTSKYKDIIAEHFDYTPDFDFLDVVSDIIDRVDDFNDEEDIWQALDDGLIYNAKQWIVAIHYCSAPGDLVWDDVLMELSNDIQAICSKIASSTEADLED